MRETEGGPIRFVVPPISVTEGCRLAVSKLVITQEAPTSTLAVKAEFGDNQVGVKCSPNCNESETP